MKYSTIVFASAFALSGIAHGAGDETITSSEASDLKVECIEMAIAEELEDDQQDAFVAQCLEEKLAAVRKAREKKS